MEYIANLFDVLVFVFFILYFQKEMWSRKQKYCYIGITSFFLYVNILIAGYFELNYGVPFVMDGIIIVVMGSVILRRNIVQSFMGFVILNLIYLMSVIVPTILLEIIALDGIEGWMNESSDTRYISIWVSKLFLLGGLGMVLFLQQWIRIQNKKLKTMSYILLPTITFTVCIQLIQIVQVSQMSVELQKIIIMVCFTILILFSINIFMTGYISKAEIHRQTNRMLSKVIKSEREKFEKIIDYHNSINKYKHDMKNKMFGIEFLLKEGKNEEALAKIQEISNDLGSIKPENLSESNIWNRIIESKMAGRKGEEITLEQDIRIQEMDGFDVVDFGIILGNLLDNAMNAQEDIQNKYIRIGMKKEIGFVYLEMENTYSSTAKTETAKSLWLSEEHGYGIRNVRELVDKYGGTYQAWKEAGVYKVRVLLPYRI